MARISLFSCIRHAAGVPVVLCLLVFASGCTTARLPIANIDVPVFDIAMPAISMPKMPLWLRGDADLEKQAWTKAFADMHTRLTREYPFTQHKGIDWTLLYNEFSPEVQAAVENQDRAGYYAALRKYIFAVPDGHMRISDEKQFRQHAIEGGFGFAMTALDDGSVRVHKALKDSPAGLAGIQFGAEIITWNDLPIRDVLANTPVVWSNQPPATAEGRRVEQCKWLCRRPVGEQVRLTYLNPGATSPRAITLGSYDDKFATLEGLRLNDAPDLGAEAPVSHRILDGGVAYMRLRYAGPSWNMPFPAQEFKKAVAAFNEKGATALVLDLRGNAGGDDKLTAQFLGHFLAEPVLFRRIAVFNETTGEFAPDEALTVTAPPAEPRFAGALAVLVDNDTIGAAEGMARVLQHHAGARVVGCHGTHGSFGVTGGDILLPGGVTMSYPVGRSIDDKDQMMLEANAKLEGGIAPTVRVPVTMEFLQARYQQDKDPVLDAALAALRAP